jgi:hypothetical protein
MPTRCHRHFLNERIQPIHSSLFCVPSLAAGVATTGVWVRSARDTANVMNQIRKAVSHASLSMTVRVRELYSYLPVLVSVAPLASEPTASLAKDETAVVAGPARMAWTMAAWQKPLIARESASRMCDKWRWNDEMAQIIILGLVLIFLTLAGYLSPSLGVVLICLTLSGYWPSLFIPQCRATYRDDKRAPEVISAYKSIADLDDDSASLMATALTGTAEPHPCLPAMVQVYGCAGELSQLNGVYEKQRMPGNSFSYRNCFDSDVTLKQSPTGSAAAHSPGPWTIWSGDVQLLIATSKSPLPFAVAWQRHSAQEQPHVLDRIHCAVMPDPQSEPLRFELCVTENGSDMSTDCLRNQGRKVRASDSVITTAFTSPLGQEDWTLKFCMRAVRANDDEETLVAPTIGVVMSETVDFYSLESELNTDSADQQQTQSQLHDLIYVGVKYAEADPDRGGPECNIMLPFWGASTFFKKLSGLKQRDEPVDLHSGVDFLVSLRCTQNAGVQISFGEHGRWMDLPGRRAAGPLGQFSERIARTGLARVFVRMHPDSGSVRLLSSGGDLYALKQSLALEPADLHKILHELQHARGLGATAGEIQGVSNDVAATGGADERAVLALNQAIRDWQEKEAALSNLRRAQQRLHLCERSRTYAEVAFPADWEQRFAGRTGYAAFPCGDSETPYFKRFLGLFDSDKRGGRGYDAQPCADAWNHFQFVSAWRIENPELWRMYQASRKNLFDSTMRIMRNQLITPPAIDTAMQKIFDNYTWEPSLESLINETVLCHGTSPSALDDILTNGLSPKYTRVAAFGKGIYFADEPGKANQYAEPDEANCAPETLAALHEQLYSHSGIEHPCDVRYLIICRVLMGHYIRSDGRHDQSGDLKDFSNPPCSVWDRNTDQGTELAKIPGTRINFHALFVDKTGGDGYREFVQFHGNRVYPAFVAAYRRQ